MKRVLTCILVSLFFSWISINLVHSPWVFDEEDVFITGPTKIKKWLNKKVWQNRFYDTAFLEKNFLIINTTNDQELTVDAMDLLRPDRDAGLPVTDRTKLFKLFKFLSQHPALYNQVICDLFFDNKSIRKGVDDSLQKYISELEAQRKIIFAKRGRSNNLNENLLRIRRENMGTASMKNVKDFYFKQSLFIGEQAEKSLPLLMFERIQNINTKRNNTRLVSYENSRGSKIKMYNSYIPEMLFSVADINKKHSNYNFTAYDSSVLVCDLGAALREPDGFNLYSLLDYKSPEKKNILVGGISHNHSDMHKTVYGDLDGSLIMLNNYYCILLGYNKFNIVFLLFLFVLYLPISWRIFFHKEKEFKGKSIYGLILKKLKDRVYYLTVLIISFISYFVFYHILNIFALLLFMELLHSLVRIFGNYKLIIIENPDYAG